MLFLLLKSQLFGFKRSELSAVSSCLLETKIMGSVFILFVSITSSCDSFFTQNGEYSSDCLSDLLHSISKKQNVTDDFFLRKLTYSNLGKFDLR